MSLVAITLGVVTLGICGLLIVAAIAVVWVVLQERSHESDDSKPVQK